MICGSGGSKVGSLKRRVRSQLARWEMKSCTPLWREAHLQVKMLKTPHARSTFGSWDVEKVHAFVARSRFASEKAKKPHVVARNRFLSQHVQNTLTFGPLFGSWDVEKVWCMLWCEADFEVKMYKTHHARSHFWALRCLKQWCRCGAKSKCAPQVRTPFGSCVVEKVDAVVARSISKSKC